MKILNSWVARLNQGFVVGLAAVVLMLGMPQAMAHLKVGPDERYLIHEDGSPFFYLGDTAWELFHRLDREEAALYLKDRAQKGFTVIQAVVLAELGGLTEPNAYGHLPLIGQDPTKPNEAYFKHVDDIVQRAAELGLTIGMLPTWGDKFNKRWGVGPEIFTPENAEEYGRFLGKRYRDQPVIWILGGDRNPEDEEDLEIIRSMAAGLEEGDDGRHLMTYHPMGGSNSAEWFHEDDWLDFNMFQSSHSKRDNPNYRMTAANYQLEPIKPTMDGEPRYEDHPVNWDPKNGWFGAFDVRQAAYWSLLAGACGHTYGNHNIWQMWESGRKPISSARTPWKVALDHPGASQMGIARRLFESRPYQTLVPDPSLIVGDPGDGAGYIQAARARDGSFLMVYTPLGKPVTVDLKPLSGSQVRIFWFDPRTGRAAGMGAIAKEGTHEFQPFSRGRGEDWVLVLEDAGRDFPEPGK